VNSAMATKPEKLEALLSRRRTITDEGGCTFENTPVAHSADSGHAWAEQGDVRNDSELEQLEQDEEVVLFLAEESLRSCVARSFDDQPDQPLNGKRRGRRVGSWWGLSIDSVRLTARRKAHFASQTATEVKTKLTEDAKIFRRDVGLAVGHMRTRGSKMTRRQRDSSMELDSPKANVESPQRLHEELVCRHVCGNEGADTDNLERELNPTPTKRRTLLESVTVRFDDGKGSRVLGCRRALSNPLRAATGGA